MFPPIFQVVLFALVAAVYAEAEADPALLYTGLGLPYAYGAYGLAATPFKSAPCVNAANVPVPCAAGNIAYAAYASPYLYGRKKREAEADPLLYAAAPGYAYAGLPYAYAGAYGLTHPSNLGICLNNVGAQVPC